MQNSPKGVIGLNTRKISLNDYHDRVDDITLKRGNPVRDKLSGTMASGSLAKWSAAAFSSAAMLAGVSHAPDANANTHKAALSAVPSQVQPAQAYDAKRVQSAYENLTDTLGWKTLVDEGVASHMPSDMLPKNQLFLTSGAADTGQYVQAMSHAQALLAHEATEQELESVSRFKSALINTLPGATDQLNLHIALKKETKLGESRLAIRDALDNLQSNGPTTEGIEHLRDAAQKHAQALSSVAKHYGSVANAPAHSDVGAQVVASAAAQAQYASERAEVAHTAAESISRYLDGENNLGDPDQVLEELEKAAYSIVDADLGQRLPTEQEFLLARHDANGKMLPGELNLDAPPSHEGQKYAQLDRPGM